MEQLTHGDQCVVHRNRTVAVYSAIAERHDHARLAEHGFACGLLEAGLMDQRREIVLVRQFERGIVLIGPSHRQLERPAGVKTSSARVGVSRRFSPSRSLKDRTPFTLKEGEIAHASPPFPICCSSDCRTSPIT